MNIVIGTAGHIDHGKTSLVKALTGVDADRFPEEKQRGITIDIGFAELDLGDNHVSFVDVPGHERFVKNMLAGASGIDLVLLVIAADEGVMPQTREHFEICRLLGTSAGIIVLTKKDMVDDELLEIVTLDAQELVAGTFLDGAPIVPVSSRSGEGLEDLRTRIVESAAKLPARRDESVARLPIDRSFSVKGFGAVVTGTLASGEFREGAEVEIHPQLIRARIRGIQSHGRSVGAAAAGQRTAINLGGPDHSELRRGMTLAEPGTLRPTQAIDCEIEVLKDSPHPLRSRQRVRVHLGTEEVLARVKVLNRTGEIAAGSSDFIQLRLESPTVCVPGEHLILRFYSPQRTIAGGRVLDNLAERHRASELELVCDRLTIFAGTDPDRFLRAILDRSGTVGAGFSELQARTGWKRSVLDERLNSAIEKRSVIAADARFVSRNAFEDLRAKTVAELNAFHAREPLAKGISRETLREKLFSRIAPEIFKTVLSSLESDGVIVSDRDSVRAASHSVELSGDESRVREHLRTAFVDAGLEVPKLDEALDASIRGTRIDRQRARRIFQMLVDSGELLKVTDDLYFGRAAIDGLVSKIRGHVAGAPDRLIDVAVFKEIGGISRKFAIPLLEYFDRERITRRAGDKRLVL